MFVHISFTIIKKIPIAFEAAIATMATEHFHHSSEWHIVVCRECRYAVWPGQVKGHLMNKQHDMSTKQAVAVSEEISEWPGIARYPGDFHMPECVEEAVGGLPVFTDGIKCNLDEGGCRYVGRSIAVVKEHWRRAHGYSVRQKRGGSGRSKKEDIERRVL